ncbi:GAF and ANTAR domain-containing protein [Terrabacter sp. MAHUQ-38]|uniref:GAF and ANTAR domain-containing protein n=1 Tax=unclassified Terrabacter TaxID=2630222 RepID=UPI00165DDF63|nr:GAF and ANTAR domain-containing protein [Terrabacter sp. MAHUQ-38]MBC9824112.1 GAF and ANTAR domain-containing protein [Terrabacter sp. MAHUQ-38]
MEPIPETHEALLELERYGDVELRGDLNRLTATAKERVPGLMGVSLALVTEDLVLTYVASGVDIAALDAVQYVDDGPCLEAIRQGETVRSDTDSLLDEGKWQLFAQANAAAGIRSTLSMPIRPNNVVTGGVNLYGAASDTFDGQVEQLASMFGAWAPGAVANADLSFETRLEAVKSPERLRGQVYRDQAIGLLVAARGLEPDAAEERLRNAAARAGVAVFVLARALVQAFDPEA